MTVPTRGWHETLRREDRAPAASNRSFGLVVVAVLVLLGGLSLWRGQERGYWLLALACIFLGISLAAPAILSPLNRLWAWIGLRLNEAATPLVMALLFYGVLTPIGLALRLAGKDVLKRRFDADAASYWTVRPASEQRLDMTRQF